MTNSIEENNINETSSESREGPSQTKRTNENLKKSVSKLTLFSIGITAGLIASFFPRLLPYLTEAEQSVTISLFTFKYIKVAATISLMIGISMVWLYMGTKEHTKYLFMSALALPAVLTGGINMSSFTSVAENKIADLNRQTVELQEELEKQKKIEIKMLDFGAIQPINLGSVPSFFGISAAHAQGQSIFSAAVDNSSVKIDAKSLEKNFVIMLDSSNDKEEIKQEKIRIQELGIPNVNVYSIGNKYYLLQNERKTKSKALLDGIKIQEQYGLTPVLIQVE